jgi:hypothetical protein
VFLLGEVEAEDGVEAVEDAAHLGEVVFVGAVVRQLVEEVTEPANVVGDLDGATVTVPRPRDGVRIWDGPAEPGPVGTSAARLRCDT